MATASGTMDSGLHVTSGVSSCVLAAKPTWIQGGEVKDYYNNVTPSTTTNKLLQNVSSKRDAKWHTGTSSTERQNVTTLYRKARKLTTDPFHNHTAPSEISRYKQTSQEARTYKRLRLDMKRRRDIIKQQWLSAVRELYWVIDTGTSELALGDLIVSYKLL